METINLVPKEQNTIFFLQVDNSNQEILKLCENGDIFVKGRLAENDKQVVDALREFLKGQRELLFAYSKVLTPNSDDKLILDFIDDYLKTQGQKLHIHNGTKLGEE